MPTYRYRCDRCGDEFEVWQSFSDETLTRHDGTCGGEVRRVLVPAGIVLKGSGFYRNDSRSTAGGDKHPGDADSAPKEKSGTEKSGTEKSGEKTGPETSRPEKPGEKSSEKPGPKKTAETSGSGSPTPA